MTGTEKGILIGTGLLILALAIVEAMAPQPADWSPSFSRYHDKPYGGKLLFERLTDVFPEVSTSTDPLYSIENSRTKEAVQAAPLCHLYINSYFSPDVNSTDKLLERVAWGDHTFIAADVFEGPLADSLGIGTGRPPFTGEEDPSYDIRAVGDHRIAAGVFRYARGFSGAFFDDYDPDRWNILAVDGASRPVLMTQQHGAGRVIVCSAPMALTNYNLLNRRNHEFVAGALSLLPYEAIIWDEAYKVGTSEARTPLRYLLSQRPLRWAWFLSLTLLVLYILVHAKREQRAIPIVLQPRNATRDLMHTIGRLYWQKGDHLDLARKMISHFKEDVRQRTYLRTFAYDAATRAHLAAKTGLPVEEVQRKLEAIERQENAKTMSEAQLLALSNSLHEFRNLIP